MSFATRLCIFVVIGAVGVVAWQWNMATDSAQEVTQLAVMQFQNDAAVAQQLQQTSLAQNWWPFVGPILFVLLGCVMFWDDVERWWKKDAG